MGNVVKKSNLELIEDIDPAYYDPAFFLINPVLPECDEIYWKLVDETIVEMTSEEKVEADYCNRATIYLIASKTVLLNQNGHDFESDVNAIINPIMPTCCHKYTKVVDGVVVEMTEEEMNVVDHPPAPVDPLVPELQNIPDLSSRISGLESIITQIDGTTVDLEDVIGMIRTLAANQKETLSMIYNL